MGSGDPSGLQNRRESALLALVSSTLTRFRHFPYPCFYRSFDSRCSLRISARGSDAAKSPQVRLSHASATFLIHVSTDPSTRLSRSGFRPAAPAPRNRLKFDSHTLPPLSISVF